MTPHDVKLPDCQKDLMIFYIIINRRLNNVWLEYTKFAEASTFVPKTILIFPIIFSELDFYEVLLERIKQRLPEEIIKDIHNEFFFSDWWSRYVWRLKRRPNPLCDISRWAHWLWKWHQENLCGVFHEACRDLSVLWQRSGNSQCRKFIKFYATYINYNKFVKTCQAFYVTFLKIFPCKKCANFYLHNSFIKSSF